MVKGFGDLFKETWNEYFSKFVPILKVFLLLELLPLVILATVFLVFIFYTVGISTISKVITSDFDISQFANIIPSNLLGPLSIPLIVILSISIIAFFVFSYFRILAFFHISFSKNKKINFKDAVKGGSKYFWPFLGLSLVLSLSLFGLFLLLIIPGVIFLIYWLFSFHIIVNENRGALDSMKRSKQMVKGKWWTIFGYCSLLLLILVGISFVAGLFIPFGGLISNLFTAPFCIIFIKNFYLDLKTKKN